MEIALLIIIVVVISIGSTCYVNGKEAGKKRAIGEIGKRLELMEGSISKEKLVNLLEKVKKEKF